ncbi:cytochrome c oxidase subunit II [Parahaliea mediterranea]|uniref:cytochrome c oxidase subunit II n=1 Tax=Parahaliea mediterranea TaxID=651086 RepID=UPI000E2EBB1C|nr:cytochrome c oxidase subunit II [Parahaliea mediterranea]
MKLVIALVVLVVGSLLFHLWSPWWFTPLASNWHTVDTTVDITLYITGAVFVIVNLFMAWAVYRYRHRPEQRARYEPENKRLETWLTVITAVGVAAMLAPGLVVWADFTQVPEDAAPVEVVGEQWQWSYRFPGEDGVLGEVAARHVGPDNPFGMNPADPAGADDILVSSNELHLPIDRPVKLLLRSKDVLHNFAVPQFRVKMDLVPGSVSFVWFTPTRSGRFDVLCMELCGIAHYAMRGQVIVDSQADFDAWLAQQTTWADISSQPAGDPSAGQQLYATCSACHGPEGQGNAAMNSPALAGLEPWYIQRQLRYYQQGIRGTHDDDEYGKQMAAMAATVATDTALRDLSAYIASLPAANSDATVEGDPARGAAHYNTCGACHGVRAQGNYALQAPRLAGQQDWYLKRQLAHFRHGIRGAHSDDNYGHQMVLMARSLQNEQSINDLLAYVNTL